MSENNSDKEICPYCQQEIEDKFFDDHMMAHEIEMDDKTNNLNNNNSNSQSNNNNSNKRNNNSNNNRGNNSNNSENNNINNLFSNILNILQPNNQSNSNDNNNSSINSIGGGILSLLGLNSNNNNNMNNNNSNNNNSSNNENNNQGPPTLANVFSTFSKTVSDISHLASQLNNISSLNNFNISNNSNDNYINNNNDNAPPIPIQQGPHFYSNIQVLPPIIIGGGGLFNPLQNRVNINAIMDLLPSSIVTEKKEEDSNCIICLSDMNVGDNVTSLPCLHVFHTDCIKHWLESKNSCPVCKLAITEESLRGRR